MEADKRKEVEEVVKKGLLCTECVDFEKSDCFPKCHEVYEKLRNMKEVK